MAREFAEWFYKSSKWYKCRKAYIAERRSIDGGMCEDCHEVPGYIVHHKVSIDEHNIHDPDVTLNPRNLKYVCIECHNIVEHGYGRKKAADEIEYTFDSDGNPIPIQREE